MVEQRYVRISAENLWILFNKVIVQMREELIGREATDGADYGFDLWVAECGMDLVAAVENCLVEGQGHWVGEEYLGAVP